MTQIGAHPQRLDLVVHAGDPIDVGIPVYDSSGATVTLSGWTASAHALDLNGTVLWDFTPSIVSNQIRLVATSAQTGAWSWSPYAVQLVVTATPAAGAPVPVTNGWIRFYRH
jgi:hypothetical protein